MDTAIAAAMREEEIRVEVVQQIDQEVHGLEISMRQVDEAAHELQDVYDSLHDQFPVESTTPEQEAQLEKAHRTLMTKINAGLTIREKIATLKHPSEQERRVQERLANEKSLRRLTERGPRMAKETAKDQGVPQDYLNESGNFRIGMDARYKSDLVSSALELDDDARLVTFKPADARKRLEQRGWGHFLTRKEEILKEKAAKAEERRKEKEAKERERAEAKAKKDEEKKAEAAKKAEEKASSTKSTSSSKTSGNSKTAQDRAQREAKAEQAAAAAK